MQTERSNPVSTPGLTAAISFGPASRQSIPVVRITFMLPECRRFLNRLLGLPVARQNLLFNYFAATLGAEIRAAKAEGRYFEGMSELAGVPKLKQVRLQRRR